VAVYCFGVLLSGRLAFPNGLPRSSWPRPPTRFEHWQGQPSDCTGKSGPRNWQPSCKSGVLRLFKQNPPSVVSITVIRGGGALRNAVELRRIPSAQVVTPAKAGVQKISKSLDSGFPRNDAKSLRIRGGRRKLIALGALPRVSEWLPSLMARRFCGPRGLIPHNYMIHCPRRSISSRPSCKEDFLNEGY
jgi:hypothetical protein